MAFIDARDLPEGAEIEADLVIIGGGMAGISIAREWAGANKRVAVLESGGREIDMEIQALYAGAGVMRAPGNPDKTIDEYPIQSRVRALGGSGHVWGGKCVPLDPSDFTERAGVPMSGWPLTREGLQPYFDRACTHLEIPPFHENYDEPQEVDRPPLPVSENFFSAPRRFSPLSGGADRAKFNAFRTSFAEAENISVYLHANVTEIQLDRRRRNVAGLEIGCLNGKHHVARGRAYVLATGGIENVRLLLASNVGDESDLVGRCFMGHVTFGAHEDTAPMTQIAVSEAGRAMTLYTDNGRDKTHCVLAATLEGQQRLGTGNFTVTMFSNEATPPTDVDAALKLSAALDRNSGAAPRANSYSCFMMSEQTPNRDSRITLLPEHRDALGMPRILLEWTYSQRDIDSLQQSVAALSADLGAGGAGRVCWPIESSQLVAIASPSRHHMGTTRMHRDPEQGVVNADCRMHGVRNLYVAGCSVFPTSGIANPTLTLIALAMRLSDHLKARLGVRA